MVDIYRKFNQIFLHWRLLWHTLIDVHAACLCVIKDVYVDKCVDLWYYSNETESFTNFSNMLIV